MNAIFLAGLILVSGSLGGAVAARCRCPRITGYIAVGILFSPSTFHLVPEEALGSIRTVTTLALGLVAYAIGASIRVDSLRTSGKILAWISSLQALVPWAASTLLIMLLAPFLVELPGDFLTAYLPLSLLLGAMACAAAPAVTVALVRECKASGPTTTLLLGVVGLTDVITIAAYSLASAISRHLVNGGGAPLFPSTLLRPFVEIIAPVAIGLVMALLLAHLSKHLRRRALFLVTVIGFSLLCTGFCALLHISMLLSNMALGFIAMNFGGNGRQLNATEDIEDLVFTIFFVSSGMLFDFSAMKATGLVTLIILGRCTGKYLGAKFGAHLAGADDMIRKFFGLALLPKAGLVIGLAIDAKTAFPGFGSILFNGMLASIIINTLLTPPLARYAIRKTGECRT